MTYAEQALNSEYLNYDLQIYCTALMADLMEVLMTVLYFIAVVLLLLLIISFIRWRRWEKLYSKQIKYMESQNNKREG